MYLLLEVRVVGEDREYWAPKAMVGWSETMVWKWKGKTDTYKIEVQRREVIVNRIINR